MATAQTSNILAFGPEPPTVAAQEDTLSSSSRFLLRAEWALPLKNTAGDAIQLQPFCI